MDTCPTCEGTGEVRYSWNVTKWNMVECERCSGSGEIPEQDVLDIIVDSLSIIYDNERVLHDARILNHELVSRGIYILRQRDLDEAKAAHLDAFIDNLQELYVSAEQIETVRDTEQVRLAQVLRDAATKRESVLPQSPQAKDFRAAANLLDPKADPDYVDTTSVSPSGGQRPV